MSITYKDAGVDIDAGSQFVEAIRPLVGTTTRPEVVGRLGGFAGLCALPAGYRDPILVSGTDGVGTKLVTALATGRHTTIGIDLVAMAVNDVVVCGAEPLFFLDYFATGRLDVEIARDVVSGIAQGCRDAGCALLGGETAELPGLYDGSSYDLAGFCVGVVDRESIRDGSGIALGDAVIGLPSSGLHSNGHSLARKALLDHRFTLDDRPDGLGGVAIADELLRPTVIYAPALAAMRGEIPFRGAAHITGGGLVDNPPRLLHDDSLAFQFDPGSWTVPPIFALIAAAGVEEAEMRRTFNMGIGMIVVVEPERTAQTLAVLRGHGARVIGEIVRRDGGPAVRFR